MPLSNKILIALIVILSFGLLSFIIFNQIENNKRQLAIESQVVQQKELSDKILRSQSEYTSKKDLESFIKQNGISLKVVEEDLKKLRADVNAVNIVLVGSLGQKGSNIPSSGTGPANPNPEPPPKCKDGTLCPNPDLYGYLKARKDLSLSEKFPGIDVPIGSVGFSAWQLKPWSIDILPREYTISSVVGKDENQRSYFYNKVSVKVGDKSYDLPIKQAATKEVYPEAKWSWWNPRIFVGADAGAGFNPITAEFTPSINVGIFSYGVFKNQPDFSVLQVGAGVGVVNQKFQVVITPFVYNVGKHLPLMNNLYIGPSLHVGSDGNVGAMAGIRVGL